jgi:putative ABC transport system permease protein
MKRDESLNNEIRDYLERETRDNIAAGMSPKEARLAARRKLGPELRVKEDTRAASLGAGWMWIERLWQDLRHGAHMMRKNPGFALIAIISIAFGTGANVAMFSGADAFLLRPLPVPRPDEVVTVGTDYTNGDFSWMLTSHQNYLDLRERNRSFAGLTAYRSITSGFSAQAGATPRVAMGMVVSANLFRALEVEPELGRTFRTEEDQVAGRDAVTVLSHAMWESLGSDRTILGKPVWIGGIEFTVIGIAPASFLGPWRYDHPEFYVPLMMWPKLSGNAHALDAQQLSLRMKGRLKPGVSLKQAQAELATLAQALARERPATNGDLKVTARTELEMNLRENRTETALAGILAVLSLAVLIVACANVAGLLTSRAPLRAREIAMRLAIGAGRPRLIRQLLTESSLIAAAGGLLGLPVGYAGIALLRQIQFPSQLDTPPPIQMDHRTLLFAIGAAVMSTILCGLIPAIQTTRADLTTALKASDASAGGRSRLWGRNLLVSVQVAASLLILTVAMFAYRMFSSELHEGMGFRTDHVLMMTLDPALIRYTDSQTQQFFERMTKEAAAVPGVAAVALSTTRPLGSADISWMQPENHRFPPGQMGTFVYGSVVDEHYFDAMDVKLVHGRGFQETDNANSPPVALVNETLAAHYWPGQDPIGKRFRVNNAEGPWVEIVGVAKALHYLFIGEPPTDFIYLPYRQIPRARTLILNVVSTGDSASLAAPLRAAVHRVDPKMPVYDVQTMEWFFQARAIGLAHILLNMITGMGVMGLALAMVGLYGLMSYSVSRRTREIGIRMAVGADRGGVLRMILRQGMIPTLGGVALGLALSIGADRLLFATFPLNHRIGPESYGIVAPALLVVAMLAALVPARRAADVDPMTALRDE